MASFCVASPPLQLCAQDAPGGQLTSRDELLATARRADSVALVSNGDVRERNMRVAASMRQRMRDGDFRVGDRVIVSMVLDSLHRDTLLVRAGGQLELPWKITVPLAGVLRSEIQERVSTELLKFVRAQQIKVTPLTRLGVLGEVARPGYFALPADTPLTDAIMLAGGPSIDADLDRSSVRRDRLAVRTTDETRRAISRGLTLDQFGLNAGDELVIGRRRTLNPGPILAVVGGIASIITVMLAIRSSQH